MEKTLKKFLRRLATDPEMLGRFILDPESVMREAKIPKKHWVHLKNILAQQVHQKLVPTPEAYTAFLF